MVQAQLVSLPFADILEISLVLLQVIELADTLVWSGTYSAVLALDGAKRSCSQAGGLRQLQNSINAV